uniref:Putative secreted protein n=1 Tax=Anopheles darlingi TaxID=43151 RepID=A0A2M4D4P3_ANODA
MPSLSRSRPFSFLQNSILFWITKLATVLRYVASFSLKLFSNLSNVMPRFRLSTMYLTQEKVLCLPVSGSWQNSQFSLLVIFILANQYLL